MEKTEEPQMLPLTFQEIDDFLVSLDKKQCPWCNGNQWGTHVTINKDTGEKEASIRVLPSASIKRGTTPDSLGVSIQYGTESSLYVILAECGECGHIYFFNYMSVRTLIEDRKEGK